MSAAVLYRPLFTSVRRASARKRGHKVVHVMIDESKNRDHSRIVMVGLIADEEIWQPFSVGWTLLLRECGIDYLHTSNFLAAEGNHRNLKPHLKDSRVARIDYLRRFGCVIDTFVKHAVTIEIDVRALKEGTKDFGKKRIDAERLAFYRIIDYALEELSKEQVDIIDFVFDDNEPVSKGAYNIWKETRAKYPFARKLFRSISFSDDQYLPPLQAADMIATITLIGRESAAKGEKPEISLDEIMPPRQSTTVRHEPWDANTIAKHRDLIRDAAKFL